MSADYMCQILFKNCTWSKFVRLLHTIIQRQIHVIFGVRFERRKQIYMKTVNDIRRSCQSSVLSRYFYWYGPCMLLRGGRLEVGYL